MASPIDPAKLDTCGCCDDGVEEAGHFNAPGLPEIDYRIGTHPDFLARMTARIHAWEVLTCAECTERFAGPDRLDAILDHIAKAHPTEPNPADLVVAERPLGALGTREPDDPAIALMDAWAVAADVVTFYQERIANESYLRTATERRSILELARAIGYELDPGVAAETFVAFVVDDAEGAPAEAEVPAGTQILSIPAGGDERPQTFETDAALTAHRRRNALRPRLTHPHPLASTLGHVFLAGTATGLEPGDRLLLVVGGTPHVRQIQSVTPDTDLGHTRIDFTAGTGAPSAALPTHPAGVLDPDQDPLPLSRANVQTEIVQKTWQEKDVQAFLTMHEWDDEAVLDYVDSLRKETFEGGADQFVVFNQRAAVFGHNAMDWKALSDEAKADYLGLADPKNLTAADKAEWPDFVIFSPTGFFVEAASQVPIVQAVTAQQVHDAVQGALGSVTATAFGAASSAGAAAASSAALVAQSAVEATERAATAVREIVSGTSGAVSELATDAINLFWNPETATGPEVQEAIGEARDLIVSLIETPPADALNLETVVSEIKSLMPGDDDGEEAEAESYLQEVFTDLAGKVRDSTSVDEKLGAIATKMATFAQTTVTGVGTLAEDITERIVTTAVPTLEAIRASASAHTQATVRAVGQAAEAAGTAAVSAVVSAAVRAALADPAATPESVADVAQRFAEAAVFVLQAYEGPVPSAVQQTLDSGLAQQIAGPLAGAQQVAAAIQAAPATGATLEAIEGFAELAQAPRIGGEQARSAVYEAIDRIEAATVMIERRTFPTRSDDTVDLDRVYKKVLEGSWALFTRPGEAVPLTITNVVEAARAEYGLSGKTTRITLDDPDAELDAFRTKVRETTVHAESEALPLAPLPLTEDLTAGTKEIRLGTMVLGLVDGQTVALTGEEVGAAGAKRSELLTLKAITHSAGYTTLTLEEGLQRSYVRKTVTINANVVLASHGETVAGEVLGSGDGAAKHQRFVLKKPPLTHRSTVGGSESELTVRVDGVAWEQAETLYGADANARAYLVRIDDDANATVLFGDGKSGARLPTGAENITATYRSGIGSDGEVGAGTLTLLKTRPFGIRSVTNPLAAAGADDPEVLDDARDNAPLTVLTLDRVVSLQDYEDYARAYPGIGKARADAVWNGTGEVVHVTVADADGDAVVEPLYSRLLESIEAARDPLRPLALDTYQPFLFFVTAKVLVDGAYVWDDVKAALETALKDAFTFEARGFGQPATAAEVLHVMHGVDGVLAVDLDELYKTAPDAAPAGSLFNTVLEAQPARFDKATGTILPAELLLIHEFGIDLTQMTA
ncbi:MAG: putative baseplate assembly protein [Rhodothermales bacterium]|nr:putative baseplate assembly protein [Rhodothermales bacterium]